MSHREPTRRLTDFELQIMQVVWEAHPEPLTVRAVVERMAQEGRTLAYTTVQTMMNILRRKGVLSARPGAGRAHEYRARVSRDEATSTMTRDFVERLFGGETRPLLAHLIEHESIPREELEEMKRLIETQLVEDEEHEA